MAGGSTEPRIDSAQQLELRQLTAVTLLATALDVFVTYYVLSRHVAAELNPFAIQGIGTLGLQRALALNLTLRLVIVGALAWIMACSGHPRARSAARLMFTAVGAWWTFVAISNVFMLAVALI